MNRRTKHLIIASLLMWATLAATAVHPYDRLTWWMEVMPIFIVFPVLVFTYRRFPLSTLAYVLISLHALILMTGGHTTYARHPLGFWLQDLLNTGRNHYDRLGHFAQGFVPAILVREILLRKNVLPRGKMLFFLTVCVCVSVSVVYEFIEWWSALILGQGAEEFLGTQGDPWDTQWDMFMALVGSVTAQLTLSRIHDRQIS